MIAALTGSGLALAAGLNAFIPLVAIGLIARFTELLALPPGWEWLSNGWVLMIFTVLLILDTLGDKIPTLDHVLDLFHTFVRPASGGIAFSAGFGSQEFLLEGTAAGDGAQTFGIFLGGLLLALAIHVTKSLLRGVVNFSTAGTGAPIVSTVEDTAALALSISAVLLPVGVVILVLGFFLSLWWVWRRRRRRRSEQIAQGY